MMKKRKIVVYPTPAPKNRHPLGRPFHWVVYEKDNKPGKWNNIAAGWERTLRQAWEEASLYAD